LSQVCLIAPFPKSVAETRIREGLSEFGDDKLHVPLGACLNDLLQAWMNGDGERNGAPGAIFVLSKFNSAFSDMLIA